MAATYSFNNGAQRRFNERIKDALDPNGILNPGKAESGQRDCVVGMICSDSAVA